MNRFLISMSAMAFIILGCAARQPQRGYRGFIDWSNDLRSQQMWTGFDSRTTIYYTGFSTSHGYQFNPWLYAGGGIEYEHCTKMSSDVFSLFVHGRSDLLFGKFTPFGDVRLGYNMVNGGGVFFSPNIGYRFNWGRKTGVNLGVGLTVYGYKTDIYDITTDPDNGYMTLYKTGSICGSQMFFTFRVGFDF